MRGSRASYTTECPIATHFFNIGAWMSSQLDVALVCKLRGSLMCLAYLILKCYPWVFAQLVTDRRPVDWCRNYMSEVYYITYSRVNFDADWSIGVRPGDIRTL